MHAANVNGILAKDWSARNWIGKSPADDTTPDLRGTCVVSLIDRRTGKSLRVNGTPLVIYTRHPNEAAADLLEGRDASVWEALIEHLGQEVAK